MCKKKTYENLDEARKSAAYVWVKKGRRLYPYKCPWCAGWHNTSLSPTEQKKEGLNTVLK